VHCDDGVREARVRVEVSQTERDVRSRVGQRQCDRTSKASRGARHECNLIGQVESRK
jgi:hypothetical protein